MIKVNTVILDPRMQQAENHPSYGTPGAAAFDLRAAIHEPLVIPPNGEAKIKTGIAMHLADHGLAGFILPRSGLGSKGLVLGNLVGLIDSDYQGELIVSAWNRSEKDFVINPLERIAQMVILPVVQVDMNIVPSFENESERGAGGFGSTGKN